MRTRTLGILALVTVLIVVGAWLTSERGSYTPRLAENERLFPALEGRVNDVAEIEIASGDPSITLAKTDAGWTDTSRGGYPVRFEPVKQLLVMLAEAEVLQEKTSDPADFARLGVAEPSAGDGEGTLVALRDASGETIASAVLGTLRQLGDARFVRRIEDDQVLLVDGRLDVNARSATWLDREVIRLDRDTVADVTVVRPDGQTFTIQRGPEGGPALVLLDIPEGRELNAQSMLSRVAYALSYVDLEDVKPAKELNVAELPTPLLASYTTTDGLEIGASVFTDDKDTWTTFKVGAIAPADATAPTPEAIARAEKLAGRLEGWAYKLGPTTTLAWDTTLTDLTKPIATTAE